MPKYVLDTNLYVQAITTDEGNAALAAFQRRFSRGFLNDCLIAASTRDHAWRVNRPRN